MPQMLIENEVMLARYRRKAIDVVTGLPLMEPLEYCRRWVTAIEPSERGYRAECIRALEKATFGVYKFETINRNWGAEFERRPESALELLRVANLLNELDTGLEAVNSSVAEVLAKVKQVSPRSKQD
jgi:hypothetical protein